MLRDGLKLKKLGPRELMAVIYTYLVDDVMLGERSRTDARKIVEDWMIESVETLEIMNRTSGDPVMMEEEQRRAQHERDRREIEQMRTTWGKLPEHRRGLESAAGWGVDAAD